MNRASVKKMCGESNVHINISKGNYAERITTLAGPTNAIFKAFATIMDERTSAQLPANPGHPEPSGPC